MDRRRRRRRRLADSGAGSRSRDRCRSPRQTYRTMEWTASDTGRRRRWAQCTRCGAVCQGPCPGRGLLLPPRGCHSSSPQTRRAVAAGSWGSQATPSCWPCVGRQSVRRRGRWVRFRRHVGECQCWAMCVCPAVHSASSYVYGVQQCGCRCGCQLLNAQA